MTTTAMNTLSQTNSVLNIAVDMPADVNQDRLADLINNTNANHTLRVELPMDTGYTNILNFAEQEGLLIRYDKNRVVLSRKENRPKGLLQSAKQLFTQPQAF